MDTGFDIAICGAGPVGMALAAFLLRRGAVPERIALIDTKPIEQLLPDPRSIALSYGSRQLLDQIGAWPAAATPIHRIHVSRRGHFGRTVIEREEFGVPALGYVARYGEVIRALAAVLGEGSVRAFRPAQVLSSDERPDAVALHLSDGRTLATRIVVQAEGGVFVGQAPRAVRRDYGQTGLIAHVRCSAPQAHCAFERFTEEGPLALLPEDDGYALVWCAHPEHAARLAALPDAEFLDRLGRAFGTRLGRFTSASPRHAFPLGLNAEPAPSLRTVAIGNAAQTLHPVGGQGLNLGLRDAAVLARLLARQPSPVMLKRFLDQRRPDRSLTIRLTDTLARIFASAPDGAPTQSALGLALGLLDSVPPAKHLLAEHFMFGWR
jgi:2-octaprenyl-6-methoxyphenol hydroxylase